MKSDEWEYPEDTWTSLRHDNNYVDLNFWTQEVLNDDFEVIEKKKILTIYTVKPNDDPLSPVNVVTDVNALMSFELRGTEGDIKPILKALGIDDAST